MMSLRRCLLIMKIDNDGDSDDRHIGNHIKVDFHTIEQLNCLFGLVWSVCIYNHMKWQKLDFPTIYPLLLANCFMSSTHLLQVFTHSYLQYHLN